MKDFATLMSALIVLSPVITAFTVRPATPLQPSFLKPASTDQNSSPSSQTNDPYKPSTTPLRMSFYADSSDYKSSESDYTTDEETTSEFGVPIKGDETGSPSEELTPVPMSKNSGNRFVAFVFDKALMSLNSEDAEGLDVLDMHESRIELTEEHVMFCRKTNLYNETFNTESMADIIWSHQILSSDMVRTVGHVMCIESTTVEFAQDVLSRDPIVQRLTGGDVSNIPFYRWRHLRDFTLRNDDGREGSPTLLFAMDRSAEDGVGNLRNECSKDHLEYLIRSNRVIATGPLHLPTAFKDDPSSLPVGNLVLFNAGGRDDAINFVENDPSAKAGLFDSMRIFRYNSMDVTGKFVAENLLDDKKNKPTGDMKEAMEYWGYPVDDTQTRWLNS
mmetsp:Transcript_34421/g.41186  ORF Transcript_34421/g.41186 Transcript_34421/m.41186 type:complete len:389 (+) Transcript_34421:113-1279(+)